MRIQDVWERRQVAIRTFEDHPTMAAHPRDILALKHEIIENYPQYAMGFNEDGSLDLFGIHIHGERTGGR